MNTVSQWLKTVKSQQLQTIKRQRLKKFLEFTKFSPEQLLKLTPNQMKNEILEVQAKLENKFKPNTILGYLSTAKTFYEDHRNITIKFRRNQLVAPETARNYHVFSNGDLAKIFEVANVEYKALISLASSTGMSIDDILQLKRETIQNIIKRAREDNEDFAFFNTIRGKTKVKMLCVLNPLCLTWVENWLKLSPVTDAQQPLFNVNYDAVWQMFPKLAKRSGITLTGKIRFHAIRKWLMSKLSSGGFNEFQIKRCIGKKIPNSDLTYLQTLDDEIKQKYPQVYEEHLSIIKTAKIIIQKDPEVKELKRIIEIQQEALQHEVKARLKVENLVERQDLSLKEHAKLIEKLSEQLRKLSCE